MKSIQVADTNSVSWGAATGIEARFAPMVERLELAASNRPRSHHYRVLAAGILGYAVLGLTLLLAVGLALAIIGVFIVHPAGAGLAFKLLIPIGGLALSLILALQVDAPPVDGIAVSRADAAELHRAVDALRQATRGPTIHEIRITADMNAAITQHSRNLFLPARNVLYLGLPLLQSLTRSEVEGVIAHEMGHFAGRHGRSASFVYFVRMRWAQLGERLPHGFAARMLRRFFAWYGPWFSAYSFVLARRQEYEADALAAKVVGADTMGRALVRILCQNARWQEGWAAIFSQAVLRPDPPASPLQTLGVVMRDEPGALDAEALQRALAERARLDDTHPSLAQRLAALGVEPQLPAPLTDTAATTMLGALTPEIMARLDADWHASVDDAWAEEYQERQDMVVERATLEERRAGSGLDRDEEYRHAQLVEVIDGPVAGAAAFAAVLSRYPDAHFARYRYGDALLDTSDEAGIASLLEAAKAEPSLLSGALDRILRYADVHGRADLIETYAPQLDAAILCDAEADQESRAVNEASVIRPLLPEQQERLIALTAEIGGVKWLRAGIRDLSTGPQIVFVFKTSGRYTGREVLDALIPAIMVEGDLIGIEDCRPRRWLTKRLKSLPNSLIQG